MTVLPTCPACGMPSNEVRCPRCNALKVVGCSGACTLCKTSCKTGVPAPPARPHDAEPPKPPTR